jgi:DNA-binding NarL/FixJ family response regulator
MMATKRQSLAVLCTELASVRTITDAASKFFELIWVYDSRTLGATLSNAEQQAMAVIIDHSATSQTPAIDLLQSVRTSSPNVKRVLLTDYCDLGIIVSGLHTGAVQHIVYKPIHAPELLNAIGAPNLPTAINAMPPRSRGQQATPIRAVG